jgi:hypothetical protein
MRVKPWSTAQRSIAIEREVVHFRDRAGVLREVDGLDVAVARLAGLDAQARIGVVLEGGELVRDPFMQEGQRIRPKSHSPPQSAHPSIRRAPSISEPSLRAEIHGPPPQKGTGPAGGRGRERR